MTKIKLTDLPVSMANLPRIRTARNGSLTKRTRGERWMKVRKAIFSRDLVLCQSCLAAGRYSVAEEIDHIIPLSQGGTDDESNLQALCKACHKAKTRLERLEGARIDF